MKKLLWTTFFSLVLFFISFPNVISQTMTFNSCACEPGFSFSGWGWYNAGGDGRAYVDQPNVNFTATITRNNLCFDLISFDKIPFGGGGGTWKVWDNTGREQFFTIGGGGTVTLNWTKIKWVKYKLDDPGTGGTNNAWDFDNLVYNIPTPVPATVTGFSASQTVICPGTQVNLSISGSLNDANGWKVYSGSCGGTLVGGTTGNSLSVNPNSTTTYYVRGEGICTPPGACANVTVNVNTFSSSLTSATADPSEACVGDNVLLSASGGTSGTGAVIVWYDGPNGTGNQLGTGASLNITASTTTTYYARREGSCNTTADVSVTVTVIVCDPCADRGGDTDGDGVCDFDDGCPEDADKTEAGQCGCGNPDTDTDNDGTADCIDGCPEDADKTEAGQCGCGNPDTDTDNDGTADCIDGCPEDPNKTEAGICGCGVADTDSDNDGTADCNDGCPDDPDKIEEGQCGCGNPDTDTDNDGTADCNDPDDDDDGQLDVDEIACGSDPLDDQSLSPDNEGDSIPDCVDPDDDNDGVSDGSDNCPLIANANQEDLDNDDIGDACDPVVNIDGAVENATEVIVNLNLPTGLNTALTNKLDEAIDRYCSGKVNQALNILNAFMNQVSGQSGNQIPEDEANYLISQAQAIIDAIQNGNIECPPDGQEMVVIPGNYGNGIEEVPTFILYPNPATDEVWLDIPVLQEEAYHINLLDLSGALIQKMKIDGASTNPIRIQLKNYSSGLYFIQIEQPGKLVKTMKLLIEKN